MVYPSASKARTATSTSSTLASYGMILAGRPVAFKPKIDTVCDMV